MMSLRDFPGFEIMSKGLQRSPSFSLSMSWFKGRWVEIKEPDQLMKARLIIYLLISDLMRRAFKGCHLSVHWTVTMAITAQNTLSPSKLGNHS